MKRRIVLVGGGGHGRVVADALLRADVWEIAGILEAPGSSVTDIFGIPVIGTDNEMAKTRAEGVDAAVVSVGSVGDCRLREELYAGLVAAGFEMPAILHPAACVSDSATIGQGAFVAAGAVVGPGARIGACCIVNTGSVVDHDCVVGDFAHVAPGAVLGGGVSVGRGAHVGTGASVIQGASVGERAVVGVGSAVVSDIRPGATAYGNPCREVAGGE